MKKLNEMGSEQLTYLKQKWSAEARELDLDSIRMQERLDAKINRQLMNQEELEILQQNLINAQELLSHLQSTGAPQDMIDKQQAVADSLQATVNLENKGSNILTDEEAYLQQAKIDELKLQRQYREDQIIAIDELLAPVPAT